MAGQRSESGTSETNQAGGPTLNEALLVGTNRILELIVAGDAPLSTLLDSIAKLAEELCDGMHCSILLFDDGQLLLGAAPSMPKQYAQAVEDVQKQAGDGLAERDSPDEDPRLRRLEKLSASYGLQDGWSEPVRDRDSQIIARFAMYYPESHAPTWFERHVIDAALHLAKVAIEHTRARRTRDESEQRFRVLVDTTTDSIWVSDPDGCILGGPETTWGELTGQRPDELANQGWLNAVHPADRAHVEATWRESFENIKPFKQEYRVRRADKTYAYVVDRGSPVRNSDGSVREWIGAVTDETNRKSAEERLRFLSDIGALFSASDDYEDVLQELARISIGRIADYCAISVQQLGTQVRRTLSATHPRTLLAHDGSRSHLECLVHALRGIDAPLLLTTTSETTSPLLGPEDTKRLKELHILSLAAAPIGAGDEHYGVLIFATDHQGGHLLDNEDLRLMEEISRRIVNAMDRARTFRELQTAIQARDDFLSVASHELKTPLTPLQLQIQSIERRPQGEIPAWLLPKLRVIRSQIERFARLVDQLLDISRIADGRVHLDLAPTDLGMVVRDLVARAEVAGEISRSGSPVTLEGEPGVIGLWDRLRLEQIIGNLLSNAIKYGQRKPIAIGWAAENGIATLRIRDSGIGIASEDQARIFTRFERAVSVRHYGGFGLGLFIVHRLVEALGGKVSVSSNLGQGSTFTVELPQNPNALRDDTQ